MADGSKRDGGRCRCYRRWQRRRATIRIPTSQHNDTRTIDSHERTVAACSFGIHQPETTSRSKSRQGFRSPILSSLQTNPYSFQRTAAYSRGINRRFWNFLLLTHERQNHKIFYCRSGNPDALAVNFFVV